MSQVESKDRPIAFSNVELDAGYRPISRWAVLSTTLGLLSFLAFADPTFWLVPIISLPIAIYAYRFLERTKLEYAGQTLTQLSLLLTMVCLFGSITQYSVKRYIIVSQAIAESDRFIDLLLDGQIKQAYVLTLPPGQRADFEDDPDTLVVRNGEAYRVFIRGEICSYVRGKGSLAQITRWPVLQYGFAQGLYHVGVEYEFDIEGERKLAVVVHVAGGTAAADEWKGRKWYIRESTLSFL